LKRTWDYSVGQTLTADGESKTISYEDPRRGLEAGEEQSQDDFVEHGPTVGFETLGRTVSLEVLEFFGLGSAGGWDPKSTVTVNVRGVQWVFWDDPWLEAYGDALDTMVDAFVMTRAAFLEKQGVKSAVLAKTTVVGQRAYLAGATVHLSKDGHVVSSS